MGKIKRALISVSDKYGLQVLANELSGLGVELVSTGGTARAIRDYGINVTDVSEVTGFPESPDGLVKTLHPRIHGAWLLNNPKNKDYVRYQQDNAITPLELVVVNLYPFKEAIAQPDITKQKAFEQIDIGGPSMVRSAAKAGLLYGTCAVVVDPINYESIINELKNNDCCISPETQVALAKKAFAHTRDYDANISSYLDLVS